MDLLAMEMRDNRKKMKVTVLHRQGEVWYPLEVNRLVNGLRTEVSQRASHPEHLVIFGHFTKERTLEVLGGGMAYTATQVTGIENAPFPCFV